jgi:hypothetical protein
MFFNTLHEPYTLVEIRMFEFIQAIISKKNWKKKLEDETILQKWKEEAGVQLFENSMIQYMLDRLNYEISLHKSVIVSPFHKIFQSDKLIPKELKSNFLKSLKKLEKNEKDWHPQSKNLVLDLVHPSLFCLVFGRTFVTNKKMKQRDSHPCNWTGTGEIIPLELSQDINGEEEEVEEDEVEYDQYGEIHPNSITMNEDHYISRKYQWLPSEINVSKDGKVKFESYINNLHPLEHKSLYKNLEEILEKFIPMFEKVLGYGSFETDPIIDSSYHYDLYEKYNYKFLDGEDSYDEEEDEEEENKFTKKKSEKTFFNKSYKAPKKEQIQNLKGRNLQVIVKLANIELTPESPEYKGGLWHMEGMKNENIIASGIYYYSSHNVTDSSLTFRHAIAQPNSYRQNWGKTFGIHFQKELNQVLGYVNTIEDRCIAFPNSYQHCVSEFELIDNTKKGHRKILVFFLVDPSTPIISTANVPPQQKKWVEKIYKKSMKEVFPSEIMKEILSYLPSTMTMEEAKDFRIKLMDERRVMVQTHDGSVFKRTCSLCEH